MWILPSQLSKCVQDTEGSVSVSDESLAKSCEQSLIVKSKQARASYFLREWKKGNLKRLRSGLILSHSLGKTSTDWYPSWLLGILVNHFQPQEQEKEKMTLDTFFPTYLKVLSPCVPLSAFLRMSKDICPLDSPASSAVWKKLVTSARSAYALRQKWVQRTNARECSSWPTIRASEYKDTGQVGSKSHTHMLGKRYLCAVVKQVIHSQQDHQNLNTGGNLPESWATPNTMDHLPQRSTEALWKQATTARKGRSYPANLREQVNPIALNIYQKAKQWATPNAGDAKAGMTIGRKQKSLGQDVSLEEGFHPDKKLSPRWVEAMMGLPIGWVMSSCANPILIEHQNLSYSETESAPSKQNEPSKS